MVLLGSLFLVDGREGPIARVEARVEDAPLRDNPPRALVAIAELVQVDAHPPRPLPSAEAGVEEAIGDDEIQQRGGVGEL